LLTEKIRTVFFTEKTPLILVCVGAAIFLILPVLFLWKEPIFDLNVPINKEFFGQFGDFVTGVVGSLWALSGVILFYIALREQRIDFNTNRIALEKQIEALNIQSEEFKLQSRELEESRKIFNTQSKTLKKQQFESTFFSLIGVYIDITKNLDTDGDYFESCIHRIFRTQFPSTGTPQEIHKESIKRYIRLYFEDKGKLSHYFRALYRVIHFIENSNFSDKEKTFYSKIVRAQLKEYQVLMLYYNANTDFGKNFQNLILKHNLLKHLPSISKLEFKKFLKADDPISIQANRLYFCDWFFKLLRGFTQQMKENRFALLEGEVLNISDHFKKINTYFELTAIDANTIALIVHLPDDTFNFMGYFNFSYEEFRDFQWFLLHDILAFSRFENEELNIESEFLEKKISFEINSDSGFNITSDSY